MIDISRTFLNAEMNTGLAVHMRLDPTMTRMMTKIAPEYSNFTDNKGCVVVQLDKALYGCVESAALWYEHLRDSFMKLGYKPNPHDVCVFNRHNDAGTQCTVAVYVDDLLITSVCAEMIEHLAQ